MTDLEAAYLAGVFDGEGSFVITSIPSTSKKSGSNRRYHLLMVSITNTSDTLMKWLESYGATIYRTGRGGLNKLKISRASWSNRRALPILEAILPYMIIKKEAVEVCLEFVNRLSDRTEKHPKFSGGRRMPNEEIRERNELQRRLYDLNGITRSGDRSRTYVPEFSELDQVACHVCGEMFYRHGRQRFCSDKCRLQNKKQGLTDR